ncbi:MAG: hypothetical protein DRQ88_10950 [Epsilonproteobacteria bacterium]|nr:MAG: hypothetical protein DRQ89_11165 [Campylobacterota bacterium]RLA64419.1 MAG: hypothetical protein DRQ88_10950 [Campylobacterota bacterium]
MYTTLSLTDPQVEYLKAKLQVLIGDIKSEIRHSQSSQMKDELKQQKHDIQNMLDQIEGKEILQAA